MRYVLALDQGTTSSRAILFDAQGHIVASAQKELRQIFPGNGLVEHDAMDIWQDQLKVARHVIQQSGIKPDQIAAMGLTNQRETTVLWDKATGEPLANAIVWQDRRTADYCADLADQGQAPMIQQKTGLLPDAYFAGSKLKWLLDNLPGARKRAERGELAFGTIDSWLVYRLTAGKVHVTDVSNASRTLLFNIHTLTWDSELLDLLDIPPEILPVVVPSSAQIGKCNPEWFGHPVPIGAMIGDQQAATFGQTCFEPGMLKNTYGTGCFLLLNTGLEPVRSTSRMLSTVGWQTSATGLATYCLEGSVFMGGATVQWLRDGLGLFSHSEDIEALAASVQSTDDMFLVPAHTGLGAPYWDAQARGLMIGMSRGTTKAHIARAALEAIALSVNDVLEAMAADTRQPVSELRVDGGASRNNLLMQMQTDMSGLPVIRPRITETTALGAAYLAGLSAGVWGDFDTIKTHWQIDRVFEPTWSEDRRQSYICRWRQAVERSRQWTTEAKEKSS